MSVVATAHSSRAFVQSSCSTASPLPPIYCRRITRSSSSLCGEILEEAATGLAARNIDADGIGLLTACLDRMRSAETHEVLVKYDERFHALVASASGNTTLASLLAGVSSQTVRARVWRGNLDRGVVARTISQHEDIVAALVARDPELAEATATIHVATTEAWIKATVAAGSWPDHAARADEA